MGVAPEREMARFSKMATLLLTMFDLPLWSLILIVACACFVLLLSAHVNRCFELTKRIFLLLTDRSLQNAVRERHIARFSRAQS